MQEDRLEAMIQNLELTIDSMQRMVMDLKVERAIQSVSSKPRRTRTVTASKPGPKPRKGKPGRKPQKKGARAWQKHPNRIQEAMDRDKAMMGDK